MPESEKSTSSVLYDRLYSAAGHNAHSGSGRDARKGPFDQLVKLMDAALDGEPVTYATHSFEDARFEDAVLQGTAVAVTKTLVAYADLTPGHPTKVRVVPLTALTTLSMSEEGAASFVTNDTKWNTRAVRATFEGLPTVTFPGGQSSMENAEEFATLYPLLIDALRTR